MASSKHFPLQKYMSTGSPAFDSDEEYRVPYKSVIEFPNNLTKHRIAITAVESFSNISSDPYTSVTSFKDYSKPLEDWIEPLDDENDCQSDENGVVFKPMEKPVFLDKTVVSAYDSFKPPLPTKQKGLKQGSTIKKSRTKSEMSNKTHDFSPGLKDKAGNSAKQMDNKSGLKTGFRICDLFHSRRKSDPSLNLKEPKTHPGAQKVGTGTSGGDESSPVGGMNDSDYLEDTTKASDDGKDDSQSCSSRPSSATGRRKLPNVPKRVLFLPYGSENVNNSVSPIVPNNIKTRFERAKNAEDLSHSVNKLSEIIENVKKGKNSSDISSNHQISLQSKSGRKTSNLRSKMTKQRSKSIDDLDELSSQMHQVGHNSGFLNDLRHNSKRNISRTPNFEIDQREEKVGVATCDQSKVCDKIELDKDIIDQNDVDVDKNVDDNPNEYNERSYETNVKNIDFPENTFFAFDANVIQGLTDSVMEKKSKLGANQENAKTTRRHKALERDASETESKNVKDEGVEFRNKQNIEGKSYNGKKGDENEMDLNEGKQFGPDAKSVRDKEIEAKSGPIKPRVERTPSYRNRVIARAKNRYKKKSTMHKECSCSYSENGDRITCQFCEHFEMRRSKSSLGNVTVQRINENCESDCSEVSLSSPRRAYTPDRLTQVSMKKSPGPVRKIQVSSRVDVLMSSDLFRKHLKKHESLLTRHTMFRQSGIRKSVSNLDLTEGFKDDNSDLESVMSAVTNIEHEDFEGDSEMSESVHELVPSERLHQVMPSVALHANIPNERLHEDMPNDHLCEVMTSERLHDKLDDKGEKECKSNWSHRDHEISLENLGQIAFKESGSSTLPKSRIRSRPPIPNFGENNIHDVAHKKHIPTLEKFKKLKEDTQDSEINDSISNDTNIDIYHGESSQVFSPRENESPAELIKLQTIPERKSQESLVNMGLNNPDKDNLAETGANIHDLRANSVQNKTKSSQLESSVNEKDGTLLEVQNFDNKSDNKSGVEIKVECINNANGNSANGHSEDKGQEKLVRQSSAPSVRLKQRVRPKMKSRTLSRLEMDSDGQCTSDSNDRQSLSVRERRKPGSKRPRSLISKKSSLVSLLKETENCDLNSDELDTSSERSILERPKLKVAHGVGRSVSDTKFETDRAKLSRNAVIMGLPEGIMKSGVMGEKGRNSVTFDLEDSGCSPYDIGESETSTSMAGSLSDSIRSEINPEEPCDDSEAFNSSDRFVKAFGQIDKPLSEHDVKSKFLDEQDSFHDLDDQDADVFEMSTQDQMSTVLRSTSDVCKITQEAARKRRERKERPYKSDPFSGTEIIPASKRCVLREEKARLREHNHASFSGSREEVLTFLDGVGADMETYDSVASLEELQEDYGQLPPGQQTIDESGQCKVRKYPSNVSSLSTDSGVIGQDGSHDSQHSSPSNTLSHSLSDRTFTNWHSAPRKSLSVSCGDLSKAMTDCPECAGDNRNLSSVHNANYQLCTKCIQRRIERKETIQEITDTEINYGRDLNLLKEEFYKPMLRASLLSREQLDAIFLNLDELIHINKHFISKLKSSIGFANSNNDCDLQEVLIGSLFLESSTMFLTFENYCVNQSQAPVLLEQFERDRELLRIFLQASQNDNQQLRRMHLKSFLMVPVQRIMRYPLLLDRLYRTTPNSHPDKDNLKEAKEKIEEILGHINAKSQTVTINRQRKSSSIRKFSCSVNEKIEVSRIALETLKWKRKDVCDVITSQLHITQPVDHLWATKKCKNYKFTPVFGVLMTLSETSTEFEESDNSRLQINSNNDNANDNNNGRVKSAAVVFIKEKNGRYQAFREPFMLEKCIVCQDDDYRDVFEVLEWNKEAYLIKAETAHETKLWVQNLKQQMNNLGKWRKRRNAMPNILLNHHQ
ncbi:uncharacterized protein LOC128241612 isoform X2 [Mya arenaria]|uniref:uncharacterized protein LOC128241612 isoform X2 n=1 Tax=Mya arenaria TaxID=6604 RepID=UPI0022E25D5A|nr:uncharacterized protein LOC128241612 isoform X2 [Mya arenaria]